MRIIAYAIPNSGPHYHRLIAPLMLMKDVDMLVTNEPTNAQFEHGCDIFMFNRVLPDGGLAKIKELQAKYDFKICIDLDDYWILDEHHILYEEYKAWNFAKTQVEHIQAADVVIVTNDRLAVAVAEYNKNVHICPNAIPKQGQFDIEREPYYLTRLFWQGSDTHRADVNLLRAPLNVLGPLSPKMKMIMAGYAEDHEDWYHMVQDYTAQLKHQYKLIPYAPITDYYKAYAQADICLIPLINSRFNRHKSNLKILEAANLGLPCIVSEVHPYLDLPVLYCRSSSDWIKHIKRLVGSRKRQKEAGQELAEFVQQHYNFNRINNMRKQVLEYEGKKVRV